MPRPDQASRGDLRRSLGALRVYLLVSAAGHLGWETLQLPLYTIWQTGTPSRLAFAVLHCTGGDVLIALASLVAALVMIGKCAWPRSRYSEVSVVTLSLGVGYTIFSEWLNIGIRDSWAYSSWMPTLPWIGTGLTPLLQWLVVPLLALWTIRRLLTSPRGAAI